MHTVSEIIEYTLQLANRALHCQYISQQKGSVVIVQITGAQHNKNA